MATPTAFSEVNGQCVRATETVHRVRDQRQAGMPLRAQEQAIHQVPHLEGGGVDHV